MTIEMKVTWAPSLGIGEPAMNEVLYKFRHPLSPMEVEHEVQMVLMFAAEDLHVGVITAEQFVMLGAQMGEWLMSLG